MAGAGLTVRPLTLLPSWIIAILDATLSHLATCGRSEPTPTASTHASLARSRSRQSSAQPLPVHYPESLTTNSATTPAPHLTHASSEPNQRSGNKPKETSQRETQDQTRA